MHGFTPPAWVRTSTTDGTGSVAKAEQYLRAHQDEPEQFWDIPADARWYVSKTEVAGENLYHQPCMTVIWHTIST